jgi:hypothetical protein
VGIGAVENCGGDAIFALIRKVAIARLDQEVPNIEDCADKFARGWGSARPLLLRKRRVMFLAGGQLSRTAEPRLTAHCPI